MDSSEIGTWVGNAITALSVILFIIVERDRLFSRKKAKQTEPISSNLVDIGLIDNLRSLIYTRILVGLIIGFAINRLLVWVFIEYSKFDGLFSNLEIPLTVLKVSISSALAILFGLFFGLLYVRFSQKMKLCFSNLRPFAEDMGYHGKPFRWDEVRRAQLRAELDAYYAHLYGLTRDELRYILDPKEVHGEDFPGETFRVLKEKEIRQFGEYRTRRLVLEAWDGISQG